MKRMAGQSSPLRHGQVWGLLLTLFAVAAAWVHQPARAQAAPAIVIDLFGRVVNARGITLTDWDGYLANPAIRLYVQAPAGAALPGTVLLSTPEPRMYFDLPSNVGSGGPTKTISVSSATGVVPFHLSIFPDRDGLSEQHALTIRFTDANGVQSVSTIPIHVVDQDLQIPGLFQVNVDFSKDQTGFYADPEKRRILRQVADDWSYFFDFNPDEVPAQTEWTWIWNPDGFKSGQHTLNASAYRGFLLYTYGIHDAQALRSGGEGSYGGGYQTVGGVATELRRSGGVEVETAGNYNQLGWFLTTGDSDWWVSGNYGGHPNDLYSIAHHEMGHALGFNGAYPACVRAKNQGVFAHPDVWAYQGSNPTIDGSDHLSRVVDRASLRGAFGNEYNGYVPPGRWLITKLDLLCLKAVGYPLRATSAFVPLAFPSQALPAYAAGTPYSATLAASGGIPGYAWRVTAGSLPPGLSLDSFTGTLSGTPTAGGMYPFTVEVRDYDEQSAGISREFTLTGQSAPELVSLAVTPDSVVGTQPATGTVTLSAAPASGVEVALASGNAAAAVPSRVTVPAGQTQASFPIATSAVASDTGVTLQARYSGRLETAQITVKAPALASVAVSPISVSGGTSATGTVTLTGTVPAGASGVVVDLNSNQAAARVPVNVTVPAGARSATFTVTTAPVAADTLATLTAAYAGIIGTADLTVKAPALSTLSLSPLIVKGGGKVTGTVTLTGPAPAGGTLVTLSESHAAAAVPASVRVPQGGTSAAFTVTTTRVSADTTGTVSATLGGVTRSVNLTVTKGSPPK